MPTLDLFEGAGAVQSALRAVNWNKTVIGPAARWPRGLQATLRTMLDSPSAMWLAYGADLAFFCNDACAPLLGARWPAALGASARAAWNSIRPEIGARIAEVLRDGRAIVDRGLVMRVERDGRQEETFQTFSYGPLRGDDEVIAGCLCIVADETERFLGSRRWAALHDLAQCLATAEQRPDALRALQACLERAAQDVPVALLYLLDEDAQQLAPAMCIGLSGPAPSPSGRFGDTLQDAMQSCEPVLLDGLGGLLQGLPVLPWGEPPRQALLMRVARPGRAEPAGVFVAGLNPHCPPNEAYRHFIGVIAGQAGAVLRVPTSEDARREAEAQDALDRTRSLLAAIIESSDDAILSKTLDGRISSWNAGAERLFGYTAEEIVGKPIDLLYPPERREEERVIVERLRRGEPISHFETVRRSKDGREVRVSMSVSPIRDRLGRIVGASNVARDLSAGARAQEALAESQARLRLATRTGRVGVWDWDPQANRITWSESLYAIHGVKADEFTPTVERLDELVHPDDRERVRAAMQAALDSDEPLELEFRAVRPDGRVVWLYMNAVRMRERGRPPRLLGATLDVTHRREAELAARESETRFARFMHGLPGLAWIKDMQGRYVFVNDAAARAFGRDRAEVYGRTDAELFPPETAQRFRANDLEALLSESGIETIETLEQEDGRHYSIVRKFPIPGADGSPGLVGGIAIDITERVRGEEALKEAKEAAEAANTAKDRFLAVLSHELRTPLTPVLMTVGALERNPALSAALREDVAMIRRNVELEARLINDLLDLSRIASGKLRLRMEAVDLSGIVRHVCDMCRSEAAEKRIRLSCELAALEGRVRGDSVRLQQVLWNLLRNSLKFTPDDGEVHVVTSRTPAGKLRVAVRDTGIGLEPASLSRIFEPFEQADGRITRQFGGLGLGLAIAKALVELHDGTIRAESDGPGRGATFIIELPETAATASTASSPPSRQAAERRLRVLVVDDHADTALVLARLLRSIGHRATIAGSVAEALALACKERYDLIISDLGLPDGTGNELMERIRAGYGIPGIAVSGYGMERDLRRSREAGFMEHLVKPISLDQLEEAMTRVMRFSGIATMRTATAALTHAPGWEGRA